MGVYLKIANKKKLIILLSSLFMILYLFCFYFLYIKIQLDAYSAITDEIAICNRIFYIKERNAALMHDNIAELEKVSERAMEIIAGQVTVNNLPDAIININLLMGEYGIIENEFIIHAISAINDDSFRQPVIISGSASLDDVILFIEALQKDKFMYNINNILITKSSSENDAVLIRVNIDIMVS